MTRGPIFAAIKAARGGQAFAAIDVAQIDGLLDRLGVPRDEPERAKLGALSERYESGGRGPGTVSSGVGDPGGVSYGLYQLASKTGTVGAFLEHEGRPWLAELSPAPGSPAFTAAWKAIAAREPERFAAAQHAFIERTHYRSAVDKVRTLTGLDLDAQAQAVRDATWSVAVQHGRAADILADAIRLADARATRAGAGYDEALVRSIYAARTAYVRKLLVAASGGTASTFRTLIESRYPDEMARALAMLA